MIETEKIESILVADCGSNMTRVVLVEVVDKTYRFVARGEAPTTLEEPYYNVTAGVLQAIAALEVSTGRRLLQGGKLILPQQPDGSGVDAIAASASAAAPLRVVAAGLVGRLSAENAARACHSIYTSLAGTLSLDDYSDDDQNPFIPPAQVYDALDPAAEFSPFEQGPHDKPLAGQPSEGRAKPGKKKRFKPQKVINRLKRHPWRTRQISRLRRLDPDIVVISSGPDASMKALMKLVDVVLEADRQSAFQAQAAVEARPPTTLVFAGSPANQSQVLEKVSNRLEVYMADSTSGSESTALQRQVSAVYRERSLSSLPGFNGLRDLCRVPVEPTCDSVALITRFLARDIPGNRVLTADLGGANSALFYADEKAYHSIVKSDFGLSYGLSNVLAAGELEQVRRWLPFEISLEELVHYALNKTLRPKVVPATARELLIEGAFSREVLGHLYRNLCSAPSGLDYNRLVATGGPLVNLTLWQTALTLLDGLQPLGASDSGLLDIDLDATMLLAVCGTLARLNPNAAAYLFQYDCLQRLGSAVIIQGSGAPGEPAAQVTLHFEDGRESTVTAKWGSLAFLPLRGGERAALELDLGRKFSVGNSERGVLVSTPPGAELTGGELGLIIDARGRPLRLPAETAARHEVLNAWHNAYQRASEFSPENTPAVPARP